MDIRALVNNCNIHASPTAVRFYQLQQQRQARDAIQRGPVLRGLRHSTPLTRDEKIEIRTLRKHAKWDYSTIAKQLNRCGRKPVVKTPEKDALVQFLNSDPMNRKLPWADLRYYIPCNGLSPAEASVTLGQPQPLTGTPDRNP
ncbi:hypothetical protein N658DRAFT_100377 [Parathielavia hyrcaniae]|uniref:Uncharacterized protein n=1 Tax=Parathielavia hyrcaniae TaxID=113614 RepID=A0AAN6SWT7_9PEZI|nr:hypothetical protein N658DRAFT_100377 [Parathielavia hyrcaniae]